MRFSRLLSVVLLAATSAAWSGPEKDLAGNEVFSNPKKQIDFGKLKYLKKSGTMFIPFVEVKLQNWGTQGAAAKTGKQSVSARSTLSVDIDPKLAQELATEIHADLVQKMRAEGWTVLTLDDVKANKHYPKIKWAKEGKNAVSQGLKIQKSTGKLMGVGTTDSSGDGYIIAVPEGQDFVKVGFTGPAWPFSKLIKDMKINVYIPTYQIQTMYFNAKGKRSALGGSASANVSSGALVSLGSASAFYLNPKLAGSGVALKKAGYGVNTGVASGVVVSSKDTSSKAGNALGAAFRAIGGAGLSRSKSESVIEADEPAIKAEALKLAAAFNDLTAKATAFYKAK